MAILSMGPPVRELMERLQDYERLIIERLFEVQSPDDFRAVLRMRYTLDAMRNEMLEASFVAPKFAHCPTMPSLTQPMEMSAGDGKEKGQAIS